MKPLILILLSFLHLHLQAGDTVYARKVINKLCSETFAGRGYVHKGDKKAAKYIAAEFERLGLEKVSGKRFQAFSFSVNTFKQTEVYYNGVLLRPGIDYLLDPSAASCHYSGTAEIVSFSATDSQYIPSFAGGKPKALLLDTFTPAWNKRAAIAAGQYAKDARISLLIRLSNQKLTWGSSQKQGANCVLILREGVYKRGEAAVFKVRVRSRLHKAYTSANVLGMLPGNKHADSTVFITAHYDHLGMMGPDALFPGANDNASGIAMLLSLASYYKTHPQPYSIVFVAFSGEENGLLGSRHYVENPLLDLKKIRFLINLDLMANGSDGMMAVNGLLHLSTFEALRQINNQKAYLPEIRARGKAANSDHYWFSEKGVPAFFFYLMGPYPHYHDVNDRPVMVPFSNFLPAFKLLTDFIGFLQSSSRD